eukprot:Tamp_05295.p1 GENE.Tamp_05295~~Tamp_05295.p1  ORF type:complete len:901 (+),score=145.01 Tamp_05295:101-2704(+)
MADAALNAVFSLFPLVIAALEGVEVNKQTCRLLAEQWRRLQPTLPTLRMAKNFGQSHMNALGALERLGQDTIAFITKFNRKGFFNKGWSHEADKAKFHELGARLSSLGQELNLNILTDARVFLHDLGKHHDADLVDVRRLLQSMGAGQAQLQAGQAQLAHMVHAGLGAGQAHLGAGQAQLIQGQARQRQEGQAHFAHLQHMLQEVQEQLSKIESAGAAGGPVLIGAADHYVKVDEEGGEIDEDEDDHDEKAELGEGSFGKTLRMKNKLDFRLCAVKQVNIKRAENQGVDIEKVKREAEILGKINHPNIVSYHACFFQGTVKDPSARKRFWIVMELVVGRTLYDYIFRSPTVSDVAMWAEQMACALEYLHGDLRIQHRDIKAQNIMVTDKNKQIKVVDLGFADVAHTSGAQSRVGTARYSSKEKARGFKYDSADDMWGVGCVLIELANGEPLTGPLWPMLEESNSKLASLIDGANKFSTVIGNVVTRLLDSNPSSRMTASELFANTPTDAMAPMTLQVERRGTCGKCGRDVLSNQERSKTIDGMYFHVNVKDCDSSTSAITHQMLSESGVAATQPETGAGGEAEADRHEPKNRILERGIYCCRRGTTPAAVETEIEREKEQKKEKTKDKDKAKEGGREKGRAGGEEIHSITDIEPILDGYDPPPAPASAASQYAGFKSHLDGSSVGAEEQFRRVAAAAGGPAELSGLVLVGDTLVTVDGRAARSHRATALATPEGMQSGTALATTPKSEGKTKKVGELTEALARAHLQADKLSQYVQQTQAKLDSAAARLASREDSLKSAQFLSPSVKSAAVDSPKLLQKTSNTPLLNSGSLLSSPTIASALGCTRAVHWLQHSHIHSQMRVLSFPPT